MILYTEKEISQHIHLNEQVIHSIEKGFSLLHKQQVEMPPIMRIDFPKQYGEVDVKSAYVNGLDKFAIKLSTGFFNNHQFGLPSGNGMMILLSTETGIPKAILLDNGYLTHLRTAAAGAVAAKYLVKDHIETVGIIGTGSQARYQIEALQMVRSFTNLRVYGRNETNVGRYIKDVAQTFSGNTIACNSAEEVVRNSDVVITTTPSISPIIKSEWLHPGLHITAMGSDTEEKNEIEASVFKKVDKIICDSKTQCVRLGELHHAFTQGILTEQSPITELGALTARETKGRTNNEEITICDLTGTGVQDTMMALYAYEQLVKNQVGTSINN